MLKAKLETVKNEALQSFKSASSSQALYDLKVKILGKTGGLSLLMRELGSLSAQERPQFGQLVNEVKRELEKVYEETELALKKVEFEAKIAAESLDMTLPGPQMTVGSQHPVQVVIDEIVDIFTRLGFSVRTGPLIEKDRYNFEALNIPKDHPARDMQDTFYIDETHVLRTQTSPIQIHSLETEQLPLRVLGPGATFRCDSDISHSPMFHQIEGMLVDKKVSMSDLKGILAFFNREFFGSDIKTRFRPSFFPFTEPSAEVDCSCVICSGKGCRMCQMSGWVEMGGCGLVHPNVFRNVGIDPEEWQGLAFGLGIERLCIMKYGVEDIRLFFENDLRFLGQFRI
ncbi:MAG: phenylalanine--tRNA ligase subunit alpha [Bdellovibrionales bacterium]|nr:phenylalanine--tRNA ligase subunit alpha [Bdellovibrionales bacterium]